MKSKMTSFNREALLAGRSTTKLEDHPLTVLRDSFFKILANNFHIESRFNFRKLRTRHAAMTGNHLSNASSNQCGKANPPPPLWCYSHAMCINMTVWSMTFPKINIELTYLIFLVPSLECNWFNYYAIYFSPREIVASTFRLASLTVWRQFRRHLQWRHYPIMQARANANF